MTDGLKDRPALVALRGTLDARAGLYKELADVGDFGAYLTLGPLRDDEEILTEPVLAAILEQVLGFPPDAYFPQLSKSGLKPDFTPMDLIAHPFVLDAKSSRQKLADHEEQIRGYINQRHLDFGVLFNLHEVRVFRRGASGHDASISFSVEPLWKLARGEAQPGPDVEAFDRFVSLFSFQARGLAEKIEAIRSAASWEERGKGDELRVDIDLLVAQLRRLSRRLAEDANNQPDALAGYLKLNPGFEERLLAELAAIAQDLQPRSNEDALPDKVVDYRAGGEFEQRVWRQYSLRVAQLTLARILLYRAWEDAGFIREQLYDGGFRDVYEAQGEKVRKVLQSAFAAGAERYHWLFERKTTYDWYAPRDEPLVDVLYSLTQFPLDRLDADVLGGLYESYVDEIDRDRLGQFYTPRDVVKFMLDRAGFSGPDGVLRIEGDSRKAVKTLDFASGSGGFDVEIARRVIDDSAALKGTRDHQMDALSAIANGVHAIEISPFPYYLTEINLLLQVSRLLGALSHGDDEVPSFVLSVVHEDALKAKPPSLASFEGLDPELRADHALLKVDERFGLSGQLDPEKQAAFTRIREGGFDLVIGNPPYVTEANNKPLFERLRRIDAWKGIYQGKSDYYYYFLYMAVELLEPGGRLCVIVPASWTNAGMAGWLRKKLAASLRLDELFLFGSNRLFAPEEEAEQRTIRARTPLVESAILIATKADIPKDHKMRVVALEEEAAVARFISGESDAAVPAREDLLREMATRAVGATGRTEGIHVHDLDQCDLRGDQPWPVKHSGDDLAPRIAADLDRRIGKGAFSELGEKWTVIAGIETGADSFTPRIRQRLERQFPAVLKKLLDGGANLGEAILQLPAGVEAREPWMKNAKYLARSPEATAIVYGVIDDSDRTNLVWLSPDDDPGFDLLTSLEKWKPLLEVRAGNLEAPEKPWWATHRARSKEQLVRPKVIGVHRASRGRFAIDLKGEWQSGKSATMVVFRSLQDRGPLAVLCGFLNSELLDLWYGLRGRTPRDIWRDYEPKPMSEIPYRHVEISAKVDGRQIRKLEAALEKNDVEEAASLSLIIGNELRASGDTGLAVDAPQAVEAARALEAIVRAISDNRGALLAFRDRFPALTRVVKDPWSTEVVDPDAGAFVDSWPKTKRASVRVDPDLEVEIGTDGALGRAAIEAGDLVFRYRRGEVGRIRGPLDKLRLLGEMLAGIGQLMPADLKAIELPRNVDDFRSAVEAASEEVAALIGEGRVLVEAAERLVCALYAIPVEFEEEVIAHAVARAMTVA